MFLNYVKRPLPKIQVAKHVRFPKVSPKNTYKPLSYINRAFFTSSIHIVHDKKYATLYYTTKDVIYFYNTTLTSLRSIVPLYHYISGKYVLHKAGIGYEPYVRNVHIPQWWYPVKAPNGDIYIVYVTSGSCEEDMSCVYNLTKSKVVHCVSNHCIRIRYPERHFRIIANSFVLIHVSVDHRHYVHLVDLVSEKVDTFKYTIHDYFRGLLAVVNDVTEKKRFDVIFSYLKRIPLEKYIWDCVGVKYILNNREGLVPFVSHFELHFAPEEFLGITFNRKGSLFVVSCRIETNELFLEFTTGEGGVIEDIEDPTYKITIPANVVLFSKRYNLDDRYDISKSYPYYIHGIAQNYIFTTDRIFKKYVNDKDDYVMDSAIPYDRESPNYKSPYYCVNDINIVELSGQTILQLKRSYVKGERRYGVHIIGDKVGQKLLRAKSLTFVNLRKAFKFLQEAIHAQNRHSEPFIDASKFMFKLDIMEKIKHILKLSEEEFISISERLTHFVYVDNVEGLLYILIVLLPESGKRVAVCWLCKCNILVPTAPCEIIAKIRLVKSKKLKDFVNATRHNVYLLDVLSNLTYNNELSKEICTWNYIHDGTLITANDILNIKINDIRKNRANMLKYAKYIYINESEDESEEMYFTYGTEKMYFYVYQDELLICKIDLESYSRDSSSIYYPLVFTELKVVKSNRI